MTRPLAALVLAAGRGERMNSSRPKVLHEAAGVPLLGHVLETVKRAGVKRTVVVVGQDAKQVRSFLNGVESVTQAKQLGTAHAVLQARAKFAKWRGNLLVIPADAPCLKVETLRDFIRAHDAHARPASVLTAEVDDPAGYGRILRRGDRITEIREELDASERERRIREVNSGIYVFEKALLFDKLRAIGRNQKKKEYYLTDVIETLSRTGTYVRAHKITDAREMTGVNTRKHLTKVHKVITEQELERHSKNGVTILNPEQTSMGKGVKIGRDTVIHPFTWIESGVTVGKKCQIGPFAKIRSGSTIEDGATIGCFVEVVRSKVGAKSNVKHLSYVGDARIGKHVNIGAGTITANYDGKRKHKTVIEDQASLGCDTILVAPVTVKRGGRTGAGAVVAAKHTVQKGKTVVGVPAKPMSKKRKKP
jgi:bifunctional UDP-N-acetylglucosamine pyrophosphorylase / glucosamine-1-phosphate N-acetyltransferase